MVYRHIPAPMKELMMQLSYRGMSAPYIADIVGCKERTVHRVRAVARKTGGGVVNTPLNIGHPMLLNSMQTAFLEGCIERQPDLYLTELQTLLWESYEVHASTITIWRALIRRGFTRKRVTRPAQERNENDRTEYGLLIGRYYRANQLVFADESHFNRHVTRRAYAWAPIGDRARRRDCFVRGKRYSILPAMSLNGILALEVSETSYTTETFNMFVSRLLTRMNPFPLPNSVLVIDNASIHKSQALRMMVERRGMRLVYLPAYSPDMNPIEEAFSCIKAAIRRNRDYVLGELGDDAYADPYAMLWQTVYDTVTPEKARGWFRDSGYGTF